jgi:hypothetical protein
MAFPSPRLRIGLGSLQQPHFGIVGQNPEPNVAALEEADMPNRCAEVLRLWLEWNEAYDTITERLFQVGNDRRRQEDLLDQLDALRRKAVKMSEDLLGV